MMSKPDGKGRNRQDAKDARRIEEMLEDLADLQCIEDRKGEEAKDLELVLKELKDAGRI